LRLHADRPVLTIHVVPLSGPAGGFLEIPERLRLNFFSILVAIRPKIAR
jgi:hypothetical protein